MHALTYNVLIITGCRWMQYLCLRAQNLESFSLYLSISCRILVCFSKKKRSNRAPSRRRRNRTEKYFSILIFVRIEMILCCQNQPHGPFGYFNWSDFFLEFFGCWQLRCWSDSRAVCMYPGHSVTTNELLVATHTTLRFAPL